MPLIGSSIKGAETNSHSLAKSDMDVAKSVQNGSPYISRFHTLVLGISVLFRKQCVCFKNRVFVEKRYGATVLFHDVRNAFGAVAVIQGIALCR